MKLGEMTIDGVRDGTINLPLDFFGIVGTPGHQLMIDAEGRCQLPIGCFVVHTGDQTVLIDAGLGPIEDHWEPDRGGALDLIGGDLPASLAAVGVTPANIDIVLLSHLHIDHCGWIWQEGKPFFPNATVKFGRSDWDTFVYHGNSGPAEGLRELAALGKVEMIEADGSVAHGITSLHTPGHTPGHQVYVLSSGTQRALILGDALACPIQLEAPEIEAISDVDRALGIRTRERILQEIGGEDLVSGPHFPGLKFGRVMLGEGRGPWV